MSLVVEVQNLATRVATELKIIRTLLNGNAADNSALLTTAKNNLVAAINELHGAVANASGIDDASTGTSTSWSSSKTNTEISNAVATAVANILGGAGPAFDTLNELKGLLDASDTADDSAIATLTTAIGNRVRFDAAQTLTAPQQAQARSNIGAAGSTEVGDTSTNFVTTFEAGLI